MSQQLMILCLCENMVPLNLFLHHHDFPNQKVPFLRVYSIHSIHYFQIDLHGDDVILDVIFAASVGHFGATMSGPRAVNDALAARSPPKDIIASVNYRLDTGFQQLPG